MTVRSLVLDLYAHIVFIVFVYPTSALCALMLLFIDISVVNVMEVAIWNSRLICMVMRCFRGVCLVLYVAKDSCTLYFLL